MIVLDSDVLSALMKPEVDSILVRFLDSVDREEIWTTSVTVFEIQSGLLRLPAGMRKSTLLQTFQRVMDTQFNDRCLLLDTHAARAAAELRSDREKSGFNVNVSDTLIAGIAIANGARIATRNTRHFADLGDLVIDPWTAAP